MSRMIMSFGLIAMVGAIVVGGTGAFFSDTETSSGNVFAAGALDLKVDNHAWYNGLECANVGTPEDPVYEWTDPEGNATGDSYLESLVGTTCTGTWELSDLDGHLFFDFDDLKPGDWEEDTISLHVEDNDAWMCANVTITQDDDVSCTEPELGDDANCGLPDAEPNADMWDGDLAEQLTFAFWLDDGDNVYEDDENIVLSGTPDLLEGYGTDGNDGQTFTIADSVSSIFGEAGTPVPGGETFYIGKAFCFGEMTMAPVAQGQNSPAVNPGFTCSGELTDNAPQTDSMLADMSFTIEQARNNEDFVCGPSENGGIACNEENDVMFVLDSSGSIDDTELTTMGDAAKSFASALSPSTPGNHIGVVDFDGDATLEAQLTDVLATIDTAIDDLSSGGTTNLSAGIAEATAELDSVRDRPDASVPDAMVIMTDGQPDSDDDAIAAANAAKAAGITLYVVGIGNGVDDVFLEGIASSPANYFTAAEFDDLEALLADLADCPIDDVVEPN